MEVGKNGHDGLHAIDAQANSISAQQVVKAAHEELLQLMRQRAEIMKRIGTVKQTIAGLANLFGDQVLGDDLLELIDRKPNGRQPGFTKACRRVLMESPASTGSAGGLRGTGTIRTRQFWRGTRIRWLRSQPF